MRRIPLLFTLALIAAPPGAASAQDVEELGRRYGTPVPDGYYEARQGDSGAFEFERAWLARNPNAAMLRAPGGADFQSGPQRLGPRSGPVVGTFEIPVLLGLFSNSGSAPPYSRDTISEAYFDAPTGTITEYYDQVSRGLVELLGVTFEWQQTLRPDTAYTVGQSGLVGGSLGGGGAGNFIVDLLDQQPTTDWGRYDNDGPDGLPNSGDDDGYVDVLAVIHPTRGAECGGPGNEDRIWSHRWSLASATRQPYTTDTPAANGGLIRINDYTIQPSISCNGGDLAPIGIFTHELGHAFGLPDLYDTDSGNGSTSGTGIWDLMGSGSWGCNNASAATPCHMGAWSKAALGWVDVVTLAPDTDHGTLVIEPVQTSGTVYRVDAQDGSGEYFLIENRQREGYDEFLFSEGLLVWQIDPAVVSSFWPVNRVNAGEQLGVWLRQADGSGHLQGGVGRGDAGDPFPGQSGNRDFHAVTTPSSDSWEGGVSGFTLYDIEPSGDDISAGVVTGFTSITVRADGVTTSDGLFTVDGMAVDPPETTFLSAPFVEHEIEVVAGVEASPGQRTPFTEWQDDPAASRVRTVATPTSDLEYVATFSGSEFEVAMTLSGGVNGVEPGSFTSSPGSTDLWFPDGAAVTLTAEPQTGFDFLGWSGDLAGQSNPATFTMTGALSAGADFELIYAVTETTVQLPAATQLDVEFTVEHGTDPVRWTLEEGELPTGVSLSPLGRLTGASLDLGVTTLTVQAVDGNGLPATGEIVLDFVAPELSIEQLASTFLLSGTPLTSEQINFLNRQGNGIAPYDIGDFRAWVLGNPTVPMAAVIAPVHRETVELPLKPSEERR